MNNLTDELFLGEHAEGQIDYRDCLTRCDHDIVRLAEALIQLGEKVIRRCPIDKPEVTPDE